MFKLDMIVHDSFFFRLTEQMILHGSFSVSAAYFPFVNKRCHFGCLENSDLRPEKLRPSGDSKTQTSKLRPSGVSKTQTRKTQTLGCLENSDPKNSDPLGVSKTQTRKIKHLHRVNAASRLVYCSLIQWHYHNLPRKEKTACSVRYVQRS